MNSLRESPHLRQHSTRQILGLFSGFVLLLLLNVHNLSSQESERPPIDSNNIANAGTARMSVANSGIIGNGFLAQQGPEFPNFEFPAFSRTEHFFQGGLHVGAIDINGDTLVSSAYTSNQRSLDPLEGLEYAPTFDPGDTVKFRSNLITNARFFDPRAVSEQDLLLDYNDTTFVPTFHVPLGLNVHMEIYNSSIASVEQMKFIRYDITNINQARFLNQMWLGMEYEPMITNLNVTGIVAGFFDDVEGYIDSLSTGYEYNPNGDGGFATTYFGLTLLGVIFPESDQLIPFPVPEGSGLPQLSSFWNFYGFNTPAVGDNPQPDEDTERYQRLSNSLNGVFTSFETNDGPPEENGNDSRGRTSNRVQTLSVGPFDVLAPGETVSVFFAMIGAISLQDLVFQAGRAKSVFESNFAVPEPPPSPSLTVIPGNHQVTLLWDRSPLDAADRFSGLQDFEGFRVRRSLTGPTGRFDIVAQFDLINDFGFDTGLPPRNETGLFKFIDTNLPNGFPISYAITSFDTGDSTIASLESGVGQNLVTVIPGAEINRNLEKKVKVVPNPYRGRSEFDGLSERSRKIYFTNLPLRCTVRIYTLAGDLVQTLEHNDSFVGDEPWNLITEDDQPLATGMYLFIVTDEDTGATQTGKFVVVF